ncbi:MAG: hypothetical protein ACC657_06520 [Thiohalomonadales bacterium]
MTSKLTFSKLTHSRSLEIKMTNILSFYEDMAISIAFKSVSKSFEIIAIEENTQDHQVSTSTNDKSIENIVNIFEATQSSNDIVSYLIERELRQPVKLTVTN